MKKLMILMLFICMTTFAQISDKKVYVVDDELIVEQTADNKGLKITGYDDQSASYARLNLDADGYAIMNVKNRLYFQILELNRMAFYPNTFRLNDNFTLAYGTNEDFQWIFDEESSGALLLKNASKSTLISFTDQGSSVQFNVNGEIVTNNPINSQGIRTLTPVADDADNFLTAFTGNNLYGGRFVANAAGTAQLPEIGTGMNLKIGTLGDIEVKVDPNISNNLILDGVQLSNGADATNLSSAGDYMDLEYFDSDTWWAETNGWSAQTFALLMADTATTKLWIETDSVGIVTGNSTGGDEVQIMYNKNRTALGANEYTSDFSVDEDGWDRQTDDETSTISASGSALQLAVTSAGTNDERPSLYHADDIMTDGEWYIIKMAYTLNSGTCKLTSINIFNDYALTSGTAELASSGVMTFVGQADTSITNYYLYFDGTSTFDLTISEITIDSLPSYHLANGTLDKSPVLTSDSLDFDGTNHSLFNTADSWATLDSISVYMVVMQDSWTANEVIFDGLGAGDFQIKQYNTTPTLNVAYPTNTNGTDKLPLDTWGVLTAIGDNTSATVQINDSTASTPGDAGTIDAQGFTIGGTPGGSNSSDIAVKALIVRDAVDNATVRKIIVDSLYSKYSIPATVVEGGESSTQLSPSGGLNLWNDAVASGDDWKLPRAGSTLNSRYYDISTSDTVVVKAEISSDSLLWTHVKMYQYSSLSPLTQTGPTQGSLWGAHEDSAGVYWVIVPEDDANYMTIEITKSSLSPDTTGQVTVHSFGVYEGVTDQLPSSGTAKSFDGGGNMTVASTGQFFDGATGLFIWGVYPSGSNEYSTYAAQGLNAVMGNYLGATDLDSCRAAGMYAMPNIAQYLIVGGALYADTAHFRSRLEDILATDSGTDSLIIYWDNEQYSEYQNVMDLMAIKEELVPEVPVIVNMGNPGMLRLWREEVEAVMTYNFSNAVPVHKIINHMNDDSLNPPGAMARVPIWYDSLSTSEFTDFVLRAVDADAYGVGLFKDGIPSDIAPEPSDSTDITDFRIWDYLPTMIDSVNTLLGL